MALTDSDVAEILRIIDESSLEELRIETASFRLHVVRGSAGVPEDEASGVSRQASASPDSDGVIVSPMLGTFFRAESPGAAPFVEVGSRVEAGTVVGIVEVMKMMNSVPAGVAGTIVEICAENGKLVEHGQPLFRVEAAA
jgi:acetyl-CoA carboxylase biotin carboxyl carrier protein